MNDIIEDTEEDEVESTMSMVDEALVAGNIANTNGLLVILAKLVAKGIFDAEDLQAFRTAIPNRSTTRTCARMS